MTWLRSWKALQVWLLSNNKPGVARLLSPDKPEDGLMNWINQKIIEASNASQLLAKAKLLLRENMVSHSGLSYDLFLHAQFQNNVSIMGKF